MNPPSFWVFEAFLGFFEKSDFCTFPSYARTSGTQKVKKWKNSSLMNSKNGLKPVYIGIFRVF